MEDKFWIKKWEENQIGFHRSEYNPNLLKYWKSFTKESSKAVFVPLAGKTLDMIYFREQRHKVYAVELSDIAIESFFKENSIEFTKNGNLYQSESIWIYCEDLFKLDKTHFSDVEFIYDRASIVALPTDIRLNYVRWMKETFPKASMFIETFSFDNSLIGPPFSISEKNIEVYYSDSYDIELIQSEKKLEGLHSDKISSHESLTFILRPKKKGH